MTWVGHSWRRVGESEFSPSNVVSSELLLHTLDNAGSAQTRTTGGTVGLLNMSRTGTSRVSQPGRCYLFAGVSDKVTVGDTSATVSSVSMRIKFVVDNQEIFTLNGAATGGVSVAAGVLTFGGSLAGSNIRVDGASTSAAAAGVLLNDNAWHVVSFDLTAFTADNVLIGTDDDVAFGNFYLHDFRLFSDTTTAAEADIISAMAPGKPIGKVADVLWLKCEDHAGVTAYDSSAGGTDGAITKAAAAFFDSSVNDQFSFQNEMGFTQQNIVESSTAFVDAAGDEKDLSNLMPTGSSYTLEGFFTSTKTSTSYVVDTLNTRRIFAWVGSGVTSRLGFFDNSWYSADAASTPNDGAEHHVAWRIDGTACEWFVDGVSVGTATITSGTPGQGGLLGSNRGAPTSSTYVGDIRKLRVWDRALVDAEVVTAAAEGEMNTTGLIQEQLSKDENPASTNLDVLGNSLSYTGQAPHDPILSSPCLTLDGTADEAVVGSTGIAVTEIKLHVKSIGDDQQILTLTNLAATAITVVGGTLTYGGGLTVSATDIDGTDYTSDLAGAGALLNLNAWHLLTVTLSAVTATDLRIGNDGSDGAGFGNIAVANLILNSTALNIPFCEGVGAVAHDTVGTNHAALVGTEAPLWAATQNLTDTLVTDGFAIATRYVTNEYQQHSGRLTTSVGDLTGAAWVNPTAFAAGQAIIGEYETTGNHKSWQMYLHTDGAVRVYISDDGSTDNIESSTPVLTANVWTHIAFVYSTSLATVVIYINGAAVASTTSGTIPATIDDSTSLFEIAASDNGANIFTGMISDVVVRPATSTAAEIASLYAGTVPGNAWRWPDGGKVECQQGLADLTPANTPNRIPVPQGAGVPIMFGPGVLSIDAGSGQSVDLGAGEANSPYAQQLAALLADLTYTAGDDDEANVLFARLLDDGKYSGRTPGDDRLIVTIPKAVEPDLSNLLEYTL